MQRWFADLGHFPVPSAKAATETKPLDLPQSLSDWMSTFGADSLIQSVSRPAMGCEFEVLLNQHQYADAVQAALDALKQIDYLESLLSVYRVTSQISKVNQFGHLRSVAVDAHTMELIQLGIDVYCWTDGAFDLTAGSLSEAWGFSRRQGAMPSDLQIRQALELVGSEHLRLGSSEQTVALNRSGVQINTGGIGKGYALDCAARLMAERGVNDFMMHGGLSSIVARGHRRDIFADGWRVALKHPWREDEIIETITLRDQALGTSGSGKQFFHFGGKRYSHIIDPRSGWPAEGMMSTTVVCPSGGVADALATGLFVLGPQAAIEFCQANPEISSVLIFIDPKSGRQRIERCNWTNVSD